MKWLAGGLVLIIIVSPVFHLTWLERHQRIYWKGVEQIRAKLGGVGYQELQVYLGKSPDVPIVVYGYRGG